MFIRSGENVAKHIAACLAMWLSVSVVANVIYDTMTGLLRYLQSPHLYGLRFRKLSCLIIIISKMMILLFCDNERMYCNAGIFAPHTYVSYNNMCMYKVCYGSV